MGNIHQGKIIATLNAYLGAHLMPVQLSNDGICHGLSILHAKYLLDGKEEEFKKLLELISNPKLSSKNDTTIFNFIKELLATHDPKSDFQFHVNFTESYKQLRVGEDKKPINSLYKLGLVTTRENWASIFQDINLQEDEVALVGSTRHAISISQKDGMYRVYDPNNPVLYKVFPRDQLVDMMDYLQKVTFRYDENENCLGLNLDVLGSKHSRPFPSKSELYGNHFLHERDAVTYKDDEQSRTSLNFAATVSDLESITWLLAQNPDRKTIMQASTQIIENGMPSVLPILLDSLKNTNGEDEEEDKRQLICQGAKFGSLEMFNTLLQEDSLTEKYNNLIQSSSIKFLEDCLKEGNPDPAVIHKVCEDVFKLQNDPISNQDYSADIVKNMLGKKDNDLFLLAINTQNPRVLEVLCQTLKQYPGCEELVNSLKNNPRYLVEAIKSNNPSMVATLLKEFNYQNNDGCINKVSLSLSQVDKTNVILLNSLLDKGMNFSTAAQNLIRKKEEEKIGILDQFGIALMRFSEFLKKHILREGEEIKITGELPLIQSEKKHKIVISDENDEKSENESDHQEKMERNTYLEQSSKQNTNVFKDFKEKFCSLISPRQEIQTNTEITENSFNVTRN